jgi:hypothetical protein
VDLLRNEVLEAEKARSDLLKWKLVLVAGLGAAGLGLNTGGQAHHLILVGVPLVCVYVDLLCHHLNLRIQLIASFIRGCSEETISETGLTLKRYELFVLAEGDKVFSLEPGALRYSSFLLAAAVAIYGLSLWAKGTTEALLLAGLMGVALTFAANHAYQKRKASIEKLETSR